MTIAGISIIILMFIISFTINIYMYNHIKKQENNMSEYLNTMNIMDIEISKSDNLLREYNDVIGKLKSKIDEYEKSPKVTKSFIADRLNNIIKDVNEHTKSNKIKKNICNLIKELEAK